jgi:hypothetical protein
MYWLPFKFQNIQDRCAPVGGLFEWIEILLQFDLRDARCWVAPSTWDSQVTEWPKGIVSASPNRVKRELAHVAQTRRK